MKLLGEGGTPKPLVMNGELKSSISLLRRIPVDPDMTLEPKLQDNRKHRIWEELQAHGRSTNIGPNILQLQVIDGAGDGHSAAVLGYDREVSRPVVFRQVKLWLIVVHVMCRIVCYPPSEVIGIEPWSHVVDELCGRQSDIKTGLELCNNDS